jgi:hypothetical protein
MRLDRNTNSTRRQKYALIKLRDEEMAKSRGWGVINEDGKTRLAIPQESIDYGNTPDTDFFVIRLKDKYAGPALAAYANAAKDDDPEYAADVLALAQKAASHPNKRIPD